MCCYYQYNQLKWKISTAVVNFNHVIRKKYHENVKQLNYTIYLNVAYGPSLAVNAMFGLIEWNKQITLERSASLLRMPVAFLLCKWLPRIDMSHDSIDGSFHVSHFSEMLVGVTLTLGTIFLVKISKKLALRFWQKALHRALNIWKASIWLNYILVLRLRYLCLKFQRNWCIIKGVIVKKPRAINYGRGVSY